MNATQTKRLENTIKLASELSNAGANHHKQFALSAKRVRLMSALPARMSAAQGLNLKPRMNAKIYAYKARLQAQLSIYIHRDLEKQPTEAILHQTRLTNGLQKSLGGLNVKTMPCHSEGMLSVHQNSTSPKDLRQEPRANNDSMIIRINVKMAIP